MAANNEYADFGTYIKRLLAFVGEVALPLAQKLFLVLDVPVKGLRIDGTSAVAVTTVLMVA